MTASTGVLQTWSHVFTPEPGEPAISCGECGPAGLAAPRDQVVKPSRAPGSEEFDPKLRRKRITLD